jgi:hypothetical protein
VFVKITKFWRSGKICRPMLIWHKTPYLRHFTPELPLGRWPLNYEVFCKKNYPNQTNGSKDNWGWPTDRQQSDRQTTDIFELAPIHMEFFWTNGVKFIAPCSVHRGIIRLSN